MQVADICFVAELCLFSNERLRRAVTREPARQDEDRVSVATGRAGEHG